MATLDFILEIARKAGDICLSEATTMGEDRVEYKGERDLVTAVDRKVEDFLRGEIGKRFPDHGFIGEERGTTDSGSDSVWIIDPIDGTTSYVHRLPTYCVSIALRQGDETVAGVVHAPALGQTFAAECGRGATMNGKPMRVSRREKMIHAVMSSGFACMRDKRGPDNLATFIRVMSHIRDIRRFGAAALDLAWVAEGKLDGYWESCLHVHDIAAGVLLVKEAGGMVCDYDRGIDYPDNGVVATNGLLTDPLLDLLHAEDPEA